MIGNMTKSQAVNALLKMDSGDAFTNAGKTTQREIDRENRVQFILKFHFLDYAQYVRANAIVIEPTNDKQLVIFFIRFVLRVSRK